MMEIDECKVYVGDLAKDVQKPELEQVFSRYGDVRDVWIAHNPPGFAFIRFSEPREARRAIRSMNGKIIAGSKIRCEVAKAAGPKGGRGGHGGGRPFGGGGGGAGSGTNNRLQGRLGQPVSRIRDNSPVYRRSAINFPQFSPMRRSRSPLDRQSPPIRRVSPMINALPPRNWSPSPGPPVRRPPPRRSVSPPIARMTSPPLGRRSPLRGASPVSLRRDPPSPGIRRSPFRRTPPQRRRSPSPMHRSISPPPRRPPSPRYPPSDMSPVKGSYAIGSRTSLENVGRGGRNGFERRSRSPPISSSFTDKARPRYPASCG